MESYIKKAEAGNKILYLASGVHYMNETWILAADGVKITGAGMWYYSSLTQVWVQVVSVVRRQVIARA